MHQTPLILTSILLGLLSPSTVKAGFHECFDQCNLTMTTCREICTSKTYGDCLSKVKVQNQSWCTALRSKTLPKAVQWLPFHGNNLGLDLTTLRIGNNAVGLDLLSFQLSGNAVFSPIKLRYIVVSTPNFRFGLRSDTIQLATHTTRWFGAEAYLDFRFNFRYSVSVSALTSYNSHGFLLGTSVILQGGAAFTLKGLFETDTCGGHRLEASLLYTHLVRAYFSLELGVLGGYRSRGFKVLDTALNTDGGLFLLPIFGGTFSFF